MTRGIRILLRYLALVLIGVAATHPAAARSLVRVDQGEVRPLLIAIPDFRAMTSGTTPIGDASTIGRNVAAVIAADLERSGYFKPVDQRAFIGRPARLDERPNFANWQAIGVDALVTGGVWIEQDGRIRVGFRLWDVFAEQEIDKPSWSPQFTSIWRRLAHKSADAIYKNLSGEDGYFDSRIVFVSESGPKTDRKKALAIMDQDGFGLKQLTSNKNLVLTPRFSPSQHEIAYMSYVDDQPRVFLYNIQTGRNEVLGYFPSMSFAPRFSPDGNRIIMSMSSGGNTEIYTMDLRSRKLKRLTFSGAIDTSPSYSPDGSRIVFNSNRGGSQQLYVMNADGSNPRRISFGNGKYGTPVWSPRGDLIAFTKMGRGRFAIGVMRPDGTGERILTNGYQDEGPTWSPNGRVIMFFRTLPYGGGRRGEVTLWTVDVTGENERTVVTPQDGSDPAWSPLLQ